VPPSRLPACWWMPRICSQDLRAYSEADAARPIPAATMRARVCTTQRLVRAECIDLMAKVIWCDACSWRGPHLQGLSAIKTPAMWHLLPPLRMLPRQDSSSSNPNRPPNRSWIAGTREDDASLPPASAPSTQSCRGGWLTNGTVCTVSWRCCPTTKHESAPVWRVSSIIGASLARYLICSPL
jgi:hypothetical protein